MKNMNIRCRLKFVLKDFGGDQQNFTKSTPKPSAKWILYANFIEISEILEIALTKSATMCDLNQN